MSSSPRVFESTTVSSSYRKLGIAVWDTELGVTTEQPIVSDQTGGILGTRSQIVLASGFGPCVLRMWIRAIGTLVRGSLLRQLDTLYLMSSRSRSGFVRDWPAYFVRHAGIRVVIHVHGSDIVNLLQLRWVGTLARRGASGCTLVSPSIHLSEPLEWLGSRDMVVCNNFVDSESATGSSSAGEQHARSLCLFWNSSFMASKGFFAVADAVASLHSQGHPACLVALGTPLGDACPGQGGCERELGALVIEPWMDYRGPVG